MSNTELSSWLEGIGLSKIKKSLNSYHISTTRHLAILDEDTLQEIVTALKLNIHERISFKVSVRQLQEDEISGPKIELDIDTQNSLKKLNGHLKNTRRSLAEMENTVVAVHDNTKIAKKAVSENFTDLRKRLETREHELITALEKKEGEKDALLQGQIAALKKTITQLSEIKRKSDGLRKLKNVDAFDEQQKAIKKELSKIDNIDFSPEPATRPELRYQYDEEMPNNLSTHGEIIDYGVIKPPAISKLKETTSTIEVFWEHKSAPGTPMDALPLGFCIKSIEQGSELETETEVDAKTESHEIKDLKKNTQYEISVRAKNKFGWSRFGKSETIKTKNIKEFSQSTILNEKSRAKIVEYLGGQTQDNLLYKGSQHGFRVSDFHRCCDNKGPTLMIIKRTGSDAVFGGYTPLSWKSSGGYVKDDQKRSFIFTMRNGDGVPAKYKHVNAPENAIYSGSDWGPVFGNANEITIYDNCNANNSSSSDGGSSCAYALQSNTTLIGQQYFTVEEIEVFSVTI